MNAGHLIIRPGAMEIQYSKTNVIRKLSALLLFLLLHLSQAQAQSLTQQLIVTDTKDSLLINASRHCFDKAGNYCFITKEKNLDFFITKDGKSKGYPFIGTTYGSLSEINYTFPVLELNDSPWYYKNARSVKVLGPVQGKLERFMSAGTKDRIAITTSFGDSVSYYLDGKLVARNHRFELKEFDISLYNWCAFSENGNAIYYVKKDSLYCLYVNGKLIDRSSQSFAELHINNSGYYVYAEGRKPKTKTDKYDYMFFIHTPDTVFGPVRTVWKNHLTENNAWYYSGDDNGPYYMLANNIMQKKIKQVSNVVLPGRGKSLYAWQDGQHTMVNVSGKIYVCPFSKIQFPEMNNKGVFSFYGEKDGWVYKFVNGTQSKKQLERYGFPATPLYISQAGESLHYFETASKIYLHRDDRLLFKPIARDSFTISSWDDLLSGVYADEKAEEGGPLFYMQYGDSGYWVYKGVLSKPMLSATESSGTGHNATGEIVAGALNQHGFFSIQKTGDRQYEININNKVYKQVLGIDTIFEDSCFFDGKELIFYGTKGLSFYRFSLQL